MAFKPHFFSWILQDINTVGDPYYSPGRRATISGSPDPYGIDAEGETFASGAEFLPEVSPFERLDYVPRTVQQPISSSSLPLSEQDLQLQHEQQQAMIGEGGDVIEDPTNPENWPDTKDNDIVKRAKTMYTMAYSMYQFTRGEGELKTTQDLFTQAEFLTEEANKFYKVVRQFTYQVCARQPRCQYTFPSSLIRGQGHPNVLDVNLPSSLTGSKWTNEERFVGPFE